MTENLAGDLGIINCRRKKKREWKGKTMGDEKAGEMKRRGIEIVRVEVCERERVQEEMRRQTCEREH
jgi:hypothetical protein